MRLCYRATPSRKRAPHRRPKRIYIRAIETLLKFLSGDDRRPALALYENNVREREIARMPEHTRLYSEEICKLRIRVR